MAIADILKTLVPQLLRGGMAGLSAPRTGSAMDLISGFNAAEEDRDKRDMLAFQRRRMLEQRILEQENRQRQIAKDEEASKLNNARIEELTARAKRQNAPAAARPDPAFERVRRFKAQEEERARIAATGDAEALKRYDITTGNLQMNVQTGKPVYRKLSERIATEMANFAQGSEEYQTLRKEYDEALQKEQGMPYGQSREKSMFPQLLEIPATGDFKGGYFWNMRPKGMAPGTTQQVNLPDGTPAPGKPERKPAPQRVSPQTQSNMDAQAIANEFYAAAGGDASTAETAIKASNDARVKKHMTQAIQILRRLQPKKGGSDLDKQLNDLLPAPRGNRQGATPKAPANDGWNKTKGGARFRPVP